MLKQINIKGLKDTHNCNTWGQMTSFASQTPSYLLVLTVWTLSVNPDITIQRNEGRSACEGGLPLSNMWSLIKKKPLCKSLSRTSTLLVLYYQTQTATTGDTENTEGTQTVSVERGHRRVCLTPSSIHKQLTLMCLEANLYYHPVWSEHLHCSSLLLHSFTPWHRERYALMLK